MKLKSSWNLAGWNLLNIINLRKRGEIQPKKNIDVQTKFGFSEKIFHLVWEEGLLDPWEETPHFFGIFWSQSLCQAPAHVARSSWIQLPGTFQRSKNGRFFFRQKKVTGC